MATDITTLSDEAQALWADVQNEYSITDPGGLILLKTALEAFDRMRGCQRAIAADGLQVKDRFDQLKPHPLLAAERDSRSQLMLALKNLNLDLEPLKKVGSPGLGGLGWKGAANGN